MVVAGCCRYIAAANNVSVVEAFACFEAILLALDRGWSKVEITGDAANVINMLNDPVIAFRPWQTTSLKFGLYYNKIHVSKLVTHYVLQTCSLTH
ncbi:hypothetical protein GQ457_13G008670 [Hibiscus cannabinus]